MSASVLCLANDPESIRQCCDVTLSVRFCSAFWGESIFAHLRIANSWFYLFLLCVADFFVRNAPLTHRHFLLTSLSCFADWKTRIFGTQFCLVVATHQMFFNFVHDEGIESESASLLNVLCSICILQPERAPERSQSRGHVMQSSLCSVFVSPATSACCHACRIFIMKV